MKGRDLAGWQYGQCHFLEIDHTCWGTFPALKPRNSKKPVEEDIIVVSDKGLLRKVWDKIEKRPAKVSSFPALINIELGVYFPLNIQEKDKTNLQNLVTPEEIETFSAGNVPFRWAPGIAGGADCFGDPVFC